MLEVSFNENLESFRARINEHLENHPQSDSNIHETASSLHSIAQSYLMEGNLSQAETYFREALGFIEKLRTSTV